MKSVYPLSRKENLVVQELDGEVLIYDLGANKAFCLNETSALVWETCDGIKSVSEISRILGEKLNVPANEDLVWLAIDQLKKEKLIANGEELVSNFAGMNRREVIKKVGLATMAVLPVVASLAAPSSANAASVCVNPANGCVCNAGTGVGVKCTTADMTTGMVTRCAAGCACLTTNCGTGSCLGMCTTI